MDSREIWFKYISLVRNKKKPLSRKNKNWIKSLGPYHEYAKKTEISRISTLDTRIDSLKMFGKVFSANLLLDENPYRILIFCDVYKPKPNSELKKIWTTVNSKEEGIKLLDDLFIGTKDLENIKWKDQSGKDILRS